MFLYLVLIIISLNTSFIVTHDSNPSINTLKDTATRHAFSTDLAHNSVPDTPDKYRTFVTIANCGSIGLSSFILGSIVCRDYLKGPLDPYRTLFLIALTMPEIAISSQPSSDAHDKRTLYVRSGIFLAQNLMLTYFETPFSIYTVSFAIKAAVNLANIVYKATRSNNNES